MSINTKDANTWKEELLNMAKVASEENSSISSYEENILRAVADILDEGIATGRLYFQTEQKGQNE